MRPAYHHIKCLKDLESYVNYYNDNLRGSSKKHPSECTCSICTVITDLLEDGWVMNKDGSLDGPLYITYDGKWRAERLEQDDKALESDYVQKSLALLDGMVQQNADKPILVPELMAEGRWSIKPADGLQAFTDITGKVMHAPLGMTDAIEAAVRLHELAHARWTPTDSLDDGTVLDGFLQAAEDRRLHMLLRENVSNWDVYGNAMTEYVKHETHIVPGDHAQQVCLELAARQGMGERNKDLDPILHDVVDECERIIAVDPTDHNRAKQAAIFARSALGIEPGDFAPEPMPWDKVVYEGTGEDEDFDDYQMDDYGQPLIGRLGINRKGRVLPPPFPPPPGGVVWGTMDVMEPPRNIFIERDKFRQRRRRSVKFGNVPRRVHRMLTDGKVFSRKIKRPRVGGAVLLDMSGSMGLSDEAIERMAIQAKHGVVAGYGGGAKSTEKGTLLIISEDHARIDDFLSHRRECGGGNIVDGPALRWLAMQPEPRVWISDGQVTGCGDSMSAMLTAEAKAICERYHIEVYNNVGEYLAAITEGGEWDG